MPEAALSRPAVRLPPVDDWRTTDQDEINRRRLRAREEAPSVVNRDERFPVFSNFDVLSASGVTYSVEIRDLVRRQFHCDCVDFRVNGLGTCKHVEAVLDQLETPFPDRVRRRARPTAPRASTSTPDRAAQTLCVERESGTPAAPAAASFRSATAVSPAATCPRWRWNCGRARPSRNCASRRRSTPGWNAAGGRTRASPCAAPTSKTSSPACGPRRKHFCRCFRTSARGCSTSPARNARCSPTRWASAKPCRRWRPARCCGGWARWSAC